MLSGVRHAVSMLFVLMPWIRRDGYGRKVSWLAHGPNRIVENLFRIIREATAKSKDGRIDQSDFLNYAASSSRYSLFTPMEASIIFHFASRGVPSSRLALVDFAQLLDAKWRAPHEEENSTTPVSFLHSTMRSAYGFVQGGMSSEVSTMHPFDND